MTSQKMSTMNQISNDLIAECKAIIDDHSFLSRDLTDRIGSLPLGIRKTVVDRQPEGECSPLFIACNQGNIRIIEYLITVCAASSDQTSYHVSEDGLMGNITPLGNACASGNILVVQRLLRLGCDVEGPFEDGLTPLQIACRWSNLTVVQELIENGADLRKQSYDGTTCLMNAAQSMPLMSYLLNNGADVNVCNIYNRTALHCSIERRSFESTCLLLEHGADPFVQNSDGDDALQTACIYGEIETADFLMQHFEYSAERQADAYELIGSSLIDRFSDRQLTLKYWQKAHHIRSNGTSYLQKRPQPPSRFAFRDAFEFTTSEELDEIAADDDALRMQSMLICDRILGIEHDETLRRLMRWGFEYECNSNSEKCIDLWILALKGRIDKYSILLCETNETAQTIVRLMTKILEERDDDADIDDLTLFEGALTVFKMLASNVIETSYLLDVQPVHLLQQQNYDQTIQCLTHLMHVLLSTSFCEDDDELIENEVRELIQIRCSINKDTLLHLAVSSSNVLTRGYLRGDNSAPSIFPSLEVTELLIGCGADVNAYNETNCTPLLIASMDSNSDREVVETLLDHGARYNAIEYFLSVYI
ncbi:protein fem-1 homolog C-like [Toxorhynchites rutilus septentrionalis]|uniref:protein fem-1 homolog C-like n=1 Tax=Toxorhynchites rutilus septentrionalis TaxID=329112 RepID=UPI00247B0E25|nr:protein fem-1 homolog C-like [Toxorhynchites rutilus septentrionalis]XP_055641412.1 protein fem-1 homolog C-like [Toxorhynchites rutilus septentrionalis]